MITFTRGDRLATGLGALIGSGLSLPMVALYFVYSGPPPLTNVLTRDLLTVAVLTAFLVFAVGLLRMLRASGGGDPGMPGSVGIAALLSWVAVTLVATSLEAGTSLWRPDGSLDPTVDGPLAAATVLLHGPVARALIATFLVGLAIAARGTALPRWVANGSVLVAFANLVMLPSLFFGMDAAFVYASNGWGSVATMGLVDMIWFGVLGAAVLPRDTAGPVARGEPADVPDEWPAPTSPSLF